VPHERDDAEQHGRRAKEDPSVKRVLHNIQVQGHLRQSVEPRVTAALIVSRWPAIRKLPRARYGRLKLVHLGFEPVLRRPIEFTRHVRSQRISAGNSGAVRLT
jgi:hypothetical protein